MAGRSASDSNGNVLKVRMDHVEGDISTIQEEAKETSRVNNEKDLKLAKVLINLNWKMHILIAAALISSAHSENVVYKALIGLIGG